MRRIIYICMAIVAAEMFGMPDAGAQYLPERRAVRKGNRQFDRQNYKNSIDRYISALDADSTCYEALYNLGNAYYQANLHRDKNPNNSFHWSDADSIFTRIGRDTLMSAERRAEALRNLGESQLTQQRFEEALASFKESLKLNPADRETKYNYILAKRIVDQQKQNQDQNGGGNDQNQNQDQNGGGGGGGGDNDQNQNNDQNQDQNKDQNQDQDQNGGNNKNNNKDNDKNDDSGKDDKQEDNRGGNDDDKNKGDNDRNDDKNDDNRDNNDERNNGGDDRQDNDRQGNPEPQKSGMSREEQQRMLEAVQAEEDKTQDKLKEKGTGVVVRGKKNW